MKDLPAELAAGPRARRRARARGSARRAAGRAASWRRATSRRCRRARGSAPRACGGVCQLRRAGPISTIVPLRGNVDTRVRKLDAGEFDAIVLACAGLKRLGHGARITAPLSTRSRCRRSGRARSAIECRADDAETLARLGEASTIRTTAHAVAAERAFLRRLSGRLQDAAGRARDRRRRRGWCWKGWWARRMARSCCGIARGDDRGRRRGRPRARGGALASGRRKLLAFTTTEIVGGE